MNRIIAGLHRGRKLTVPKGQNIRPTTDRMRERLFSMLTHSRYPAMQGARVADLYAGTGALGLEALSRGAAFITFIENARTSITVLEENITLLKASADTKILKSNAQSLLPASEPYDFIFMDPPYRKGLVAPTFASIIAQNWLAPEGVIICELASDEELTLPAELTLVDERTQGQQRVVFVTAAI